MEIRMKSLRSFAFLWILAGVSIAVSAQTALKIENGRQRTGVSLDALKALPHKTVTVHNPHENTDETYAGGPLIELLKQVGAPTGKEGAGKTPAEYVSAQG